MLGTLAIIGDYTHFNRLAYLNPLLIFGVAIFDTIYVMILRIMKGQSPFLGSKDHFAIRLKIIGWPIGRIVLTSYIVGGVLGLLALLNMYLTAQDSLILYGTVAVFFLVLGFRLSRVKVF